MSEASRSLESVSFKRVAGGFVFRAPNPWLFGTPGFYLVNEAQKAEIQATMKDRRPILALSLFIIAILLWSLAVALLVWRFGSGQDNPAPSDMLVMAGLIVLPGLLAAVIIIRRWRRRLQPILAGLPRTDERITNRELRQATTAAMPLRVLLLLGVFFALIFIFDGILLFMRTDRHPLFSDTQSIVWSVLAVGFGALSVTYFAAAIRKAMERRHAN